MASRISSTLDECEHQFRKPKVSITDAYVRKLKREGTKILFKKNGNHKGLGPHFKKRKPLKKVARARRTELGHYFALSTEFLLRPENEFCAICIVRREHGENILVQIATEIHHWAGRIGRLLCYVKFWKPSCRGCRSWPHDHGQQARDWGLLAPPALWNVYPASGD